ncbi:MAG: PAS domain-containing protein [Alphaproteobacteria bacterium]|nr:PAS domain-containing protein [Alphaproteobacteria bacterium]
MRNADLQEAGALLGPETPLCAAARRIVSLWESLRPAPDLLPGRRHFDPVTVPGLLPGIWLLERVDPPAGAASDAAPRLRCRLYAAGLAERFGRDLTGRMLDEADVGFEGSAAERDFQAILADGRPRWWRGPVAMQTPRTPAAVEVVMLPLAADGRRVDMILCYARPLHALEELDGPFPSPLTPT